MVKASHKDPTLVAAADNYKYLHDYVRPIPGWLNDYAAIRTMDLLTWQEQNGVHRPLFEIGVYLGRHLALMLRSALRTGDSVVGLDTFQYAPLDTVKTGLTQIADPDSIIWLQTYSTSCSSRQILQLLGGEPRFISIDGSHERDDVVWDLRLAEDILAPRGIVSVNDFLNPITLGVNDGVHNFFAMPRNLAPVAYTTNKLFLCRPGQAASYRQAFEDAVMADQIEPRSATFRQSLTQGRHLVEQNLWGKPPLVVP
jgi:hypothetical protein